MQTIFSILSNVTSQTAEEELSDIAAIHRVLAGDAAAFRTIVEAHQTRLYRFCLTRTRNEEAAADAVQEILLRAYRALVSFRMGQSFRTWLFSIAANYLRTRWKRSQAETARLAKVWEPEALDQNDPEYDALMAQASQDLHWAMGELPEDLYLPVYLFYFEGLAVAEIAQALHLGNEAVKTRLFRGRKKLRELLEREQPTKGQRGSSL